MLCNTRDGPNPTTRAPAPSPTAAPAALSWEAEMLAANYEIGPLAEDWLVTLGAANKSPRTVKSYAETVASLLRWFDAQHGRPLCCADLDGSAGERLVQRYLLARQREGCKPASLLLWRGVLRLFSAYLHKSGYLAADGITRVEPIRQPRRLFRVFTPEEIDRVEAYLATLPNRATWLLVWRLLLDTGLRRQEVATLRVADCELEDRRGQPLPRGRLRVTGKGSKQRDVGPGRVVTALLRRYLREQRPEPADAEAASYLFLSASGRPYSPDALTNAFGRWRVALGLPHLHPHTCRHTYATRFLVEFDGDIATLSILLGHATLQQTLHYAHLKESGRAVTVQQQTSPVDARLAGGQELTPARLTHHQQAIRRIRSANRAGSGGTSKRG